MSEFPPLGASRKYVAQISQILDPSPAYVAHMYAYVEQNCT